MSINYKNLVMIGTSHIAKQSVKEVNYAIKHYKPAVVAVELDRDRYLSLKSKAKSRVRLMDIFHIGVVGFIFVILGAWAQKKLGNLVGSMPGSEMIAAINLAKKSKAEVALIDQPIQITLRRLSASITLKEKFRFIYDIIKSVLFRKSEMKRLGVEILDLSKVPSKELIQKLMIELKRNYPNVHRVLVEERNRIMASRLADLMEKISNGTIVAVVGAGHEEEMIDIIKEIEKKKENQEISYSFRIS